MRLDSRQHFWKYNPAHQVWMTDDFEYTGTNLDADMKKMAADPETLHHNDAAGKPGQECSKSHGREIEAATKTIQDAGHETSHIKN
jgi:hypothetical protein